jgi:membrane-associated phospholipid phosphatase
MSSQASAPQAAQARSRICAWLIAFAICVTLILICVVYVDRPSAEFFERHFRHTQGWVWLNRAFMPLNGVVVLAFCFVLGCGAWRVSARPLPAWTATPLLCSWAAMLGLAAEFILKRIFGRAWPDMHVREGFYGFHWLSTGWHWEGSFPSGTADISVAIVTVIWLVAPRWRASAMIAGLLCVGVVVANFHWPSDVIAGIFVGAAIGTATVKTIGRDSLLT